MTETLDNTQDLLMDVDKYNFWEVEGEDAAGEVNSKDMDMVGVDEKSGAPVFRLTDNNDEQPLNENENGNFKFKMNTIATENMAYLTEKDKYKLYPSKVPGYDNSREYSSYVSKVFELYNDLDEHRVYSAPTIGIINKSYAREHNYVLNVAFESFVTELNFFIESIKNDPNLINRVLQLEESITILNCLKTIHFTFDSLQNESDSREQFVNSLIDWVNRSDGEPKEEYIEQIFTRNDNIEVFNTLQFWKLVNKLLLRGLFEQALGCLERSKIMDFLKSQCEVSANILGDAIALLEQYPIDSSETFREWKFMVLGLQQTYSNSNTKITGELRDYIEDTLLLIGGNQSKLLQYSSTWYEAYASFYLYYIPTLELSHDYLELALSTHPLDLTKNWEQACVNIINNKIYSILPVLESLDLCTAATTAALCEAKGILENFLDDDTKTFKGNVDKLVTPVHGMASYLLNQFAFELCSQEEKTLWPVAIGLISISPFESASVKRTTISEVLPRFPFSTNDDIEWMLAVCAKWRLPKIAKKIYKILGSKLQAEGNVIESMTNFSKAGEFDIVKNQSWLLFEEAVFKGEPLDDVVLNSVITNNSNNIIPGELLDSLVTNAMRQTLSPYAVLYEFFQAKFAGEWEKSLQLLLALLEFEFLPKHYLLLLLTKFLFPLYLNVDNVKMDESSILRSINCINKKLDCEDDKSKKMYEVVLEKQPSKFKILPADLSQFSNMVRERLSIKLCQEFM
ncbi:hypothetical protein Kpol_170p2 [Vanderwaltozyma polyspora DSM 70294]|uniref:Nuclear pore complex protein Nup85 n=1 Tax=Vanderwaltozyma polyspora (strain ATCC 22028 / DSM 70294 / BCRC 21397 / CBS 2163 / NBRC 10782 / NRRL Y-8283 / UCD 57-17) TaxID=436907 RepID=A7TTT1_VANPO|nr:uncharacterized protein Kpol_170p2 [Vanderwaltozyma polyspora DSM 70294]EDO14326.1 hypothetical protein Kpol_170p2 [Vanderwaltozyma polyspora DSM 70294]